MANSWMTHLRSFYSKNKHRMSYKQAMKAAKKTYKSVGKKVSKASRRMRGSKRRGRRGNNSRRNNRRNNNNNNNGNGGYGQRGGWYNKHSSNRIYTPVSGGYENDAPSVGEAWWG